jgi:hypothetical protein
MVFSIITSVALSISNSPVVMSPKLLGAKINSFLFKDRSEGRDTPTFASCDISLMAASASASASRLKLLLCRRIQSGCREGLQGAPKI